jgi:hypothetical protein
VLFFLQFPQSRYAELPKRTFPLLVRRLILQVHVDTSASDRDTSVRSVPLLPIFQQCCQPLLSSSPSLLLPPSPSKPQHKVDNNRQQQRNSQHRGSKAIIKATLPSHADALRAPVESDKRVEARADLADAVAEVEEADGQAAQDDGEVEPGEEGALVGEEDFGLDAGGEGDAFACC